MQTNKRLSYRERIRAETRERNKQVEVEQSNMTNLAQLLGVEVDDHVARNVARWRVKNGAKFQHYSDSEGRDIAIRNGAKRSLEFAKRCFWYGGLLIYIERSKK